MDREPDNCKDPPPNAAGTTPKPVARRRRTQQTADVTITPTTTRIHSREYTKTVETSTSTERYVQQTLFESPPEKPQRLRRKVAEYEKVWSSGDNSELQTSDENLFEIDVQEIEKRLREERQRGLAEAETAKLAFQQMHLRATPESPARRVIVQEQTIASPFNVTLRTSTKVSAGSGYVQESPTSPFNVTLRATRRNETTSTPNNVLNGKQASALFLENETTLRDLQAENMPRNRRPTTLQRLSVTPPRSVDITAGGQRILIKLEDEHNMQDETDSSVQARIRKYQQATTADDSGIGLGNYGNIDITVGSRCYYEAHTKPSLENREKQVTVETKPQQQVEIPWQTTNKTITKQQIKTTTTAFSSTETQESQLLVSTISDITDDSDTEGISASNIVILPATIEPQKIEPEHQRVLRKGLQTNQTSPLQSTNNNNNNSNEYQDFQFSMAAKGFTRSNSQYDSHIREMRGN